MECLQHMLSTTPNMVCMFCICLQCYIKILCRSPVQQIMSNSLKEEYIIQLLKLIAS